MCPVTKCPRCARAHNIQLCPQEDQDQTLVVVEEDEGFEDEEEIKAWLEKREWPEMLILSCEEATGDGSNNIHTLMELTES